jgi:large subunit ribosomal protein L25
MEINELNALVREASGKGVSRRLRSSGLIPAVFYGPGKETILLKVSAADLAALRKKEENAFIKLIIDDRGNKIEKLSILKELQIEPSKRSYVHADFYEIDMDHTLTFDISIHFSGKPKGVTDGGELHILKRELKVSCLPARRPEFIVADLSDIPIGGSFKVQDIAPLEDVLFVDHGDVALATVSAVKVAAPVVEAETVAEESPAEPPEEK